LEVEIDTANKEIEVSEAKRSLQEKQFDNGQTLIRAEIANDDAYQNAADASADILEEDEQATNAAIVSDRTETNDIKNSGQLSSARTMVDAGKSAESSINAAGIYAEREIAEIKAAQHITASLEHLIG